MVKAVIFDVDGVLIDSLPEHLKFCDSMNLHFELNLTLPSVEMVKARIRAGVRISPMEYFFIGVGFPRSFARQADECYQREFAEFCTPKKFDGVDELLDKLVEKGVILGIVTANTFPNIEKALGQSITKFRKDLIYCKDTHDFQSKAEALEKINGVLAIESKEILYVGDQPSDYVGAFSANVPFIGVTYGWGFDKESNKDHSEPPFIDEPLQLMEHL